MISLPNKVRTLQTHGTYENGKKLGKAESSAPKPYPQIIRPEERAHLGILPSGKKSMPANSSLFPVAADGALVCSGKQDADRTSLPDQARLSKA